MNSTNKKISLLDVKQALNDPRFRDSLGVEFQEDVAKYLTNPGCRCNLPVYRRIVREAKDKLLAYFPQKTEVWDESEDIKALAKNNFSVINCHINELESKLRKLSPGRKQVAVCRYEEQVTVVVNELDVLF